MSGESILKDKKGEEVGSRQTVVVHGKTIETGKSSIGWREVGGIDRLLGSNLRDLDLRDKRDFLTRYIDDKYFGQWWINAGVIVFATLSTYLIARLRWSFLWVMVILLTCGTYYKVSIRQTRMRVRDDISRELAKQRIETDTESAEWINSFLIKFWAIYEPVLSATVVGIADQVLAANTPSFLEGLRLSKFTLGTKPPRIDSVKTYPKSEDDIVLMDWRFSFTPNDTADLTMRQLATKVNPKVVLGVRIGKGVVSKELPILVEDMSFKGFMRFKLKLMADFPHVKTIDVCFLEKPEFGYALKPIGGETFGFDIGFVPGLSAFIREQVHANLGPMLYAPNVYTVNLEQMLSGDPLNAAIGVLQVTIHNVNGIKNPEAFSGTPDPYVKLSFDRKEEIARTRTIRSTNSPQFEETKYILVPNLNVSLTLEVYDFNDVRKDRFLGAASFEMKKLETEHVQEGLVNPIIYNGKTQGQASFDVRYFPVLKPTKLEDGTVVPPPETNTGIVRFVVHQAKDLGSPPQSIVKQYSPYAVMTLNGQEVHKSKKLKKTNNPSWEESFEFLVSDKASCKLGVIIKDDRNMDMDPVLGSYQIKLSDLIQNFENGNDWFSLANTTSSSGGNNNSNTSARVRLEASWKPVAFSGLVGKGDGYVKPKGVLRLHITEGKDLPNAEVLTGVSDPYVKVTSAGIEISRTAVVKSTLNPKWDQVFWAPVRSGKEKIILEVFDFQKNSKDRSLGHVEIDVADFAKKDDEGEYMVNDSDEPRSVPIITKKKREKVSTLVLAVSFFPTLNVAEPEKEETADEEDTSNKKLENKVVSNGVAANSTKAVNGETKKIISAEVNGEKKLPETPVKAQKTSSSAAAAAQTPASVQTSASVQTPASVQTTASVVKTPVEVVKTPSKENSATAATTTTTTTTTTNGNEPTKNGEPIKMELDELLKMQSGFLVFEILDVHVSKNNTFLEILFDDMVYPSFTSTKIKANKSKWEERGDGFVRELDFSQITLRLREKPFTYNEENIISTATGNTIDILKACYNQPNEFTLKGKDGVSSTIKVSARYIPVKMTLKPRDSITNMGSLRVDLLSGKKLPSADRNGKSDPFVKFVLNGEKVFQSETKKKTLNPTWNQDFTVPIACRATAIFHADVYDWDFSGENDYLGGVDIPIADLVPFQSQNVTLALNGKSGEISLRLLFKPEWIRLLRSNTTGTFSAGRMMTGIAGAPLKGVGMVADGVGAVAGGVTGNMVNGVGSVAGGTAHAASGVIGGVGRTAGFLGRGLMGRRKSSMHLGQGNKQ